MLLLQVSVMFIVVLIVFGLCWLPYHAYFIYNYYADLASQVSSHWSTSQYILGPDWSSPPAALPARLPRILLAGHGQLRRQPDHLLPHECQVCIKRRHVRTVVIIVPGSGSTSAPCSSRWSTSGPGAPATTPPPTTRPSTGHLHLTLTLISVTHTH